MSEQQIDEITAKTQAEQAEAQQSGNLPAGASELPEGAQHVFKAAFDSAQRDGLGEEAATQVAWTTVKHDYRQAEDGSWHFKPEETNIHNKAIPSGGN